MPTIPYIWTLRFLIFIPIFFLLSATERDCKVTNNAFKAGEVTTYKIFYNWGLIWVEAGHATFSCELGEYAGKPAYHFEGIGRTYDKYDFLYKVRDHYDSYADTNTLRPLRYRRNIDEGGRKMFEDARFSYKTNKVYSVFKTDKTTKIDSVPFGPCVVDVMTAIFYARCLDFGKCKKNDTIPFDLYLENKCYPIYVRYIGKEEKEIGKLGKMKCIKFKPLLIEGTIFKGGEDMTVWVTDDEKKIPVYVETPILVGKIKVMLAKKP